MGTGHTVFSPSGSVRYCPCPGSMAFYPPNIDNPSSEDAKLGTFAHSAASNAYLMDEDVHEGMQVPFEEDDGTTVVKEVPADMVIPVNQYLKSIRKSEKGADKIWMEDRVAVERVIGIPGESGTLDHGSFHAKSGTLIVDDLKYGMMDVSATENEQLIIYAGGCVAQLMEEDPSAIIRKIELRIHQVRKSYEPKEWAMSFSRFNELVESYIFPRAQEALLVHKLAFPPGEAAVLDPSIPAKYFHPGKKQCAFCNGRRICPAVEAYGQELIDADFTSIPSLEEARLAIRELSDEELGKRVVCLDLLSKVISDLWAECHKRMLNGKKIPGQKLVTGKKGNRSWLDARKAENTLKLMKFKADEMYSRSLASPAQIEKLCKGKRKNRWTKLQALIGQSDGKPTIVPEDDPREEYNIKTVESEFSAIDEATVDDAIDDLFEMEV